MRKLLRNIIRKTSYQKWTKKNPGKSFSDYYVKKVFEKLDKGNEHPTLGKKIQLQGKGKFDFLVKSGIQPYHKCVDYGCGSLRIGKHFIKYLNTGTQTDRF